MKRMKAKEAYSQSLEKRREINEEGLKSTRELVDNQIIQMVNSGEQSAQFHIDRLDNELLSKLLDDLRKDGYKTCLVEKKDKLQLRISVAHYGDKAL